MTTHPQHLEDKDTWAEERTLHECQIPDHPHATLQLQITHQNGKLYIKAQLYTIAYTPGSNHTYWKELPHELAKETAQRHYNTIAPNDTHNIIIE